MSKKSRSSKRQTRVTSVQPVPRTRSEAAPISRAASARPFEREFNPDYSYVAKDLKRIGTLAGTFFVLLVVLSFFLK
jgi:hypothetical protein